MQKPALAALICCTLISYIRGSQNTHVDNHSKWTILVTTSYLTGESKFIKRAIPPGGSAVDTYNPKDNVNLDVQVQDAEFSNHFMVDGDTSVIAQDTPGNKYGVDFYEASKVDESKGKPILTKQVGGETVSALKTRIFAPGPPPASPAPESPVPDFPPVPDGVHPFGPSATGVYVIAYDKQGGHIRGRLYRAIGSSTTLSSEKHPDQTSCGDIKSCFVCQEPCKYIRVLGLSGGVPAFFKFDVTMTAFNGDRSVFVSGPHKGSNGNDLEEIDDSYFQSFDKVILEVAQWGVFPPSPPPSPA